MVNFRFHLVSLTAVFLALAAGIAIGAGVVDRQTVDFLEARLRTVENNRAETNAANDRLQSELDVWQRFAGEAGDRMVEGRLEGEPVVLVAIDGTDRALVDTVRATIQASGAALQGSLWFTEKWALDNGDDVEALAAIVSASPTSRPQDLRGIAISTLVSTWSGGRAADMVIPLRDAGFLEFDPAPGQPVAIDQVPLSIADVVTVASGAATVQNVDVVIPFAQALLGNGIDVVTAEPTVPAPAEGEDEPPLGAAMVVRANDDIAAQVSTVDNIDDYRGRIALILAVDALAEDRTGHYGTGDGAERLLPEAPA